MQSVRNTPVKMSNNIEKQLNVNVNGTSQGIKIKTEPGVSARLSSFKPPRDLTLGASKASNKKVFVPNLNVVRNKSKSVAVSESGGERRKDWRGGAGRGGGGGRGRGRPEPNIVKAGGVFSEGVAAGPRHSSSRAYYGGRESDGPEPLAKPTLRVKQEWKVDKETEEQQIKELMNDDDEVDTLTDTPFAPTRLPVNTDGGMLPNKGQEVTAQLPIKQEIKSEPLDDTEIKDEPPEIKTEKKFKMEFERSKDASSLLQADKPTLLLLQFPDSLPGRGPDEEVTERDKTVDNAEQKPRNNVCTARHLEEGQIGKIVIFKSGKIKLVIGNTYYDLSMGTQACFRQDVMSVSVDSEARSGSVVNLGPIQSKLTATPDWERMFQQMEAS